MKLKTTSKSTNGLFHSFGILHIFLVVSMFVTAPVYSAAPEVQQALTKFVTGALLPVVGPKRPNMKYKIQVDGDDLILILEGTYRTVPLTRYQIRISPLPSNPAIPALTYSQQLTQARQPYTQLNGRMALNVATILNSKLEEEKNLVRLLLRADPLLLPQLTVPGLPKTPNLSLTDPQQKIVKDVNESLANQRANANLKVPRALIFLPTGVGKTVLACEVIGLQRNVKQIYFIVENKEILKEAAAKFAEQLKISPADVAVVTGDYLGDRDAALRSKKIVAITRSGLTNRLTTFEEHLANSAGDATAFVLDEAQHLGRKDGQFDAIIKVIEKHAKSSDLILGLSATPWHTETDFVKQFFGSNIFSAFLTESEQAQVLENHNLVQLATTMTLRAMAAGYLNPIFSYNEIATVPGLKDVTVRELLKRDEMRLAQLSVGDAAQFLERQINVHQPLLQKMLHEIVESLERDEKTNYWNRGLIFVPSIAHANVYAFLLNKLRRQFMSGIAIDFKAYHSALTSDESGATMDWFKDEELRGRATVHKYMVVVKSAGEGFDFPAINHLIAAKPYNSEDQIGIRELLQHLGRATRLAPFKTSLKISDFTGDMRRLFEGLDSNLLRNFASLDQTLSRPSKVQRTSVKIDEAGTPGVTDLVTQTTSVVASLEAAKKEKPAKAPKTPKVAAADIPEAPKVLPFFEGKNIPPYILKEMETLKLATPFDVVLHFSTALNRDPFHAVGNVNSSLVASGASPTLAEWLITHLIKDGIYKTPETLSYFLDNVKFRQQIAKGPLEFFQGLPVSSDSVDNFLHAPFTMERFKRNAEWYKIPLFTPRYQDVADHLERETLSPFRETSDRTTWQWLTMSIADWPMAWRTVDHGLTSSPGKLSTPIKTAAISARTYTLLDFLLLYYTEDFVEKFKNDFDLLLQTNSLAIYRKSRSWPYGSEDKPELKGAVGYNLSKSTVSERIAYMIYVNTRHKNGTVLEKYNAIRSHEFYALTRLIDQLIARAKMLGFSGHLTSEQAQKLRALKPTSCREFLETPEQRLRGKLP